MQGELWLQCCSSLYHDGIFAVLKDDNASFHLLWMKLIEKTGGKCLALTSCFFVSVHYERKSHRIVVRNERHTIILGYQFKLHGSSPFEEDMINDPFWLVWFYGSKAIISSWKVRLRTIRSGITQFKLEWREDVIADGAVEIARKEHRPTLRRQLFHLIFTDASLRLSQQFLPSCSAARLYLMLYDISLCCLYSTSDSEPDSGIIVEPVVHALHGWRNNIPNRKLEIFLIEYFCIFMIFS